MDDKSPIYIPFGFLERLIWIFQQDVIQNEMAITISRVSWLSPLFESSRLRKDRSNRYRLTGRIQNDPSTAPTAKK